MNHIAGFPVVGGVSKARCNDDPLRVFMKDKSVAHSKPPRLSIKATRAIRRMKPRAHSGPWKRGWMRSFMGSTGRGDAGRNAKLMVVGAIVVVVPVVNQPITGRKPVTLSEANE